MNEIFFPSQYKKALLAKTKNTTIRMGKEIGKYQVGQTYLAKSYAGRDWKMKVKIRKVLRTTVDHLSNFNIPARSIEAMKRKEKISADEAVDLIRFEILS